MMLPPRNHATRPRRGAAGPSRNPPAWMQARTRARRCCPRHRIASSRCRRLRRDESRRTAALALLRRRGSNAITFSVTASSSIVIGSSRVSSLAALDRQLPDVRRPGRTPSSASQQTHKLPPSVHEVPDAVDFPLVPDAFVFHRPAAPRARRSACRARRTPCRARVRILAQVRCSRARSIRPSSCERTCELPLVSPCVLLSFRGRQRMAIVPFALVSPAAPPRQGFRAA